VLDKGDVDGGSGEQGARERRDELCDLAHSYSHSIVYVIVWLRVVAPYPEGLPVEKAMPGAEPIPLG
jgi:hypothetical protein